MDGAWRRRRREGAAAAAAATGERLDALERGDGGHLPAGVHAERPSDHGRVGMCGRLDVYSG